MISYKSDMKFQDGAFFPVSKFPTFSLDKSQTYVSIVLLKYRIDIEN